MPSERIVKPTTAAVIHTAAERLVAASQAAIAAHGHFAIALAGGHTPEALYSLLAAPGWRSRLDWQRTHICFGDERAVPPDDEHSNYRMAESALLAHVPVPASQVHRMRGEVVNLEAAALEYEAELKALGSPLDLVLLGMGDDGHTASLFPHSPQLQERQRLCVATPVAPHEPHVRRLTLTYPALNAATEVLVLVTGAEKQQRVYEVLEGPPQPDLLPIQGVQPASGRLVWLLDAAAAASLPH